MGWFDDNGANDWNYRGGGYAIDNGPVENNAPAPDVAAPFNQFQQVGHDGKTSEGLTREQWRDAWQSSGARSIDDLNKFVAQHGGKVISGNGTVTTPFGETGDILIGARTNGNGKAGWLGDGSGQTGGGDTGAFGRAFIDPSIMAGAVAAAGSAGGGSARGGGNYLPEAYNWKDFDPASVDMNADPGVAFRIKEANRAMQNSAAAKGTLLSGGFQKALQARNQEMASQEYGNAFQRAFATNQVNNQGGLSAYQAKVGAGLGQGNLDLGFTRAGNDYALGVGQLALGNKSADQNYDLGLRGNALGYYSAGNSYDLGSRGLDLGWANYGLNADNQNFNQGYSLAGMGLNGAGAAGSYGSSYGNAAGNYMTGAGNATAAGQVGAANAWGNAFNNGINNAAGIYYYGQGRKG